MLHTHIQMTYRHLHIWLLNLKVPQNNGNDRFVWTTRTSPCGFANLIHAFSTMVLPSELREIFGLLQLPNWLCLSDISQSTLSTQQSTHTSPAMTSKCLTRSQERSQLKDLVATVHVTQDSSLTSSDFLVRFITKECLFEEPDEVDQPHKRQKSKTQQIVCKWACTNSKMWGDSTNRRFNTSSLHLRERASLSSFDNFLRSVVIVWSRD